LTAVSVGEVARRLDERLPAAWSEDWDNVGLIIGDPDARVERIAVALDATEECVVLALKLGCRMLVVHHPAIFRPMKRIVEPSPEASMIRSALSGGVAVYSSHTNWDSSPDGVNVVLSRMLGLLDVSPIMPQRGGAWGMGAVGNLSGPMSLSALARLAKDVWGLSTLLAYGGDSTPLSRVALCGGAGGDLLQAVKSLGADVFITADVGYHYLLHARLSGMRLVVVNHGEMESASLPALRDLVREAASLEAVLLESGNWTPLVI
jgi:dinuclear metal center YbgI/SA1388 family protein